MANVFLNIPAPAANGAGAPVDVSAMSKTKSIVCGGGFVATVNIEYSTDDVGAGPWAPLATFLQAGNLTIDVAAHWMRAVTSEYKSGAPNVDVGSSDAGSLFALLPLAGTPVDVSTLPLLKTVVAPVGFAGNIEVSEDGVSWAQIFSFQNGGGSTRQVVAQFARVIAGIGGTDVWIGGANDSGGGGGCPCPPTTEHVSGDDDPPLPLNPSVDTSFIENNGGGETTQDFTLGDGTIDGQIHNIVNESTGIVGVKVTPDNLFGGTFISAGFSNASATLIWNAPGGEWYILGAMLGFTLT